MTVNFTGLKGETQVSCAEAALCMEEQDVREFRAQYYPHKKPRGATDRVPGISHESPPPDGHFQNRGYFPLGTTRLPKSEAISTLLLHELGNTLDALELALEAQFVKVRSLRSLQEALPLMTGPNPPHLVFTAPTLPDGTWADVVNLVAMAPKPGNVIVVARLVDVQLYVETITRGAFDFIVPPLTGYELTHVVRCAVENTLSRRDAQASSV